MRAYVIATDGLRVRKEPKLDGKILKKLPYRATLEVDRIVPGQWSKVISTTSEMWVHGSYLSAIDPGAPFVSPISYSRVNLHMGAGGWQPTDPPNQLKIVSANKVSAMFVPTYQPQQAAETIRLFRTAGVEHFVLRATAPFVPMKGANWGNMAIRSLRPFVDAIGGKSVMIQLHNEPNMYSEGLEVWGNGVGYNKWFIDARAEIVKAFPNAKIGFSPLSPGESIPNERFDEKQFIADCKQAISLCDWVATHCYYINADASDLAIPVAWWEKFAQGKPILCTEAGPVLNHFVTIEGATNMFKAFAKARKAAFAWILDHTKNPAFAGQSWSAQNIVLPSFG